MGKRLKFILHIWVYRFSFFSSIHFYFQFHPFITSSHKHTDRQINSERKIPLKFNNLYMKEQIQLKQNFLSTRHSITLFRGCKNKKFRTYYFQLKTNRGDHRTERYSTFLDMIILNVVCWWMRKCQWVRLTNVTWAWNRRIKRIFRSDLIR